MNTAQFDEFLTAARAEPAPQRLLFVFGVAELPPGATPGQAKRHREGRGGTLAPVMCVDKSPDELTSFADLARESEATGQPWDMVFAGALAGRDGAPPAPADIERALRGMIGAIHRGAIENFLVLDRQGQALQLS
jgi:hypothetical protein